MRKLISDEDLKIIENKLLSSFDDYCKANNLEYFLAYGTLLGAVRHEGFIPWDDDIDVMMPRKDFDIFIHQFNNDKPQNMSHIKVVSVLDDDYYLPIAKLIDLKTVLKEKIDIDSEIGVYIDIFPLDGISNDYSQAKRIIKRGYRNYEKLMLKTISINNNRSKLKNLILKLGKIALKKLSAHELSLQIDNFSKNACKSEASKYIGVFCDATASNPSGVFQREWFEPAIELPFEGKQYLAPSGYDPLLKQLYGDYMKYPPKNERVTHHSFEAWYKE